MPAIINKFFTIPFANSGDTAVIPNAIQPSGSISYTQGFTVNYTFDPNTNPAALEVPRLETNQIFLDTTTALKQYQVFGTPNFISTSDNLGTPYPYDTYCRALYDDGSNGLRPYISLSDSNSTLPTDTSNWIVDDLDIQTWRQSKYNTYISTGTPNALVVNPADPYLTADLGTQINVVANATNTGPATLNISGLGAIPIVLQSPIGFIPILPGEIVTGMICEFICTSTNAILKNPSVDRTFFSNTSTNLITPIPANTNIIPNMLATVDNYSWFNPSNNRFTPNISGWYDFFFGTAIDAGATNRDVNVGYILNGSVIDPTNRLFISNGYNSSGTARLFFNGTTDYIQLAVRINGATGNITGATAQLLFISK